MKIKYVIFNEMNPALVSQLNNHSDVRGLGRPTSAGFCQFEFVKSTATWNTEKQRYDGDMGGWKVGCWGESISLGLKSRPEEDAKILEKMLNAGSF